MSILQQQKYAACLLLDHYRAAQIVMEQYGAQGEGEILQHIVDMTDRNDQEGAHLWLCVLMAYQNLQKIQNKTAALH